MHKINYNTSNKMTVEIIVDLCIHPERMEEFNEIIQTDKKMAEMDSHIQCFDIEPDIEMHNKIKIRTLVDSMESLKQHMSANHYKWKDFMKSGGVISHSHSFNVL